LPTLEIKSLSRLRRFVSGRQPALMGLRRGPRLSVAGALPGFQRHAVVRRPVEPVVSAQSATAFAGGDMPSPPTARAGQVSAETAPARRSPPSAHFFQSLLTGAPAPSPAPASPKRPAEPPTNQSPPAPRWQRLVERAARDPAQRLPARLHDFLGGRLKRWLPSVQIHQGLASDELTSAMRADAVTFADRIVVRHRRYQPDRPEGVALLGHELFHVAEAADPHRRLPAAAEEHAALSHEHRLLHEFSTPKTTAPGRPRGGLAVPTVVPHAAADVPMTAPVRTAREERSMIAPSQPTADGVSERQLAQLKDQVYRDLLQRLRTEFERGS
jgi:hypothetical protein